MILYLVLVMWLTYPMSILGYTKVSIQVIEQIIAEDLSNADEVYIFGQKGVLGLRSVLKEISENSYKTMYRTK